MFHGPHYLLIHVSFLLLQDVYVVIALSNDAKRKDPELSIVTGNGVLDVRVFHSFLDRKWGYVMK